MMPLVNRTSSSMSASANNDLEASSSHGYSSHGSTGIQIQVMSGGAGMDRSGHSETDGLLPSSTSPSNSRNGATAASGDVSKGVMLREVSIAFMVLLLGWYGPKKIIVPYMLGGVRQRPIPYQDFNGDVILDFDLLHPLVPKDQVLVPSIPLIVISTWMPWIIMMCVCFWPPFSSSTNTQRKNHSNWNLACTATCAIFVSTGLSELTTSVLKAYVGRLRPNFYAMCEFSQETKQCLSSEHEQEEARKSFPSGHSSLSMQGMVCLSLFLVGQLLMAHSSKSNTKRTTTASIMADTNGKDTNTNSRRPSICLAFLAAVVPIWVSLFVGASRLVDTWHHPSDVLAGWVLGGWSAIVAYHYYFSSPLIQLFYNVM